MALLITRKCINCDMCNTSSKVVLNHKVKTMCYY
ncbi:Uncharacterised protein [Serratia fonticola]|nr:Uncharacterised protein [Serratia fonticola]